MNKFVTNMLTRTTANAFPIRMAMGRATFRAQSTPHMPSRGPNGTHWAPMGKQHVEKKWNAKEDATNQTVQHATHQTIGFAGGGAEWWGLWSR